MDRLDSISKPNSYTGVRDPDNPGYSGSNPAAAPADGSDSLPAKSDGLDMSLTARLMLGLPLSQDNESAGESPAGLK